MPPCVRVPYLSKQVTDLGKYLHMYMCMYYVRSVLQHLTMLQMNEVRTLSSPTNSCPSLKWGGRLALHLLFQFLCFLARLGNNATRISSTIEVCGGRTWQLYPALYFVYVRPPQLMQPPATPVLGVSGPVQSLQRRDGWMGCYCSQPVRTHWFWFCFFLLLVAGTTCIALPAPSCLSGQYLYFYL